MFRPGRNPIGALGRHEARLGAVFAVALQGYSAGIANLDPEIAFAVHAGRRNAFWLLGKRHLPSLSSKPPFRQRRFFVAIKGERTIDGSGVVLRLADHPPDDEHGWYDPQEAGQEEIGEVDQWP